MILDMPPKSKKSTLKKIPSLARKQMLFLLNF